MDNNKKVAEYKQPNVLWSTIQRKIEIDIINGTYKSTERVPSIVDLSKKYDIGRSTAKKVLEIMYKEGILEKKSGIGFFVLPLKRNYLKKKLMIELDYGFNKYIHIASELNMDKASLQLMINEVIEKVYKEKETKD